LIKKFILTILFTLVLSVGASASESLMVPNINYPGLKNLKEFNLKIDSNFVVGDMCKVTYELVEKTITNIIQNKSNIKFSNKLGHEQFEFKTPIFIKNDTCFTHINLKTYSWEKGQNTSGSAFTGHHISFADHGRIVLEDYSNFKKEYLNTLEKYLLDFIIFWQKHN
jgi:hypothetical protein